MQQEENLSLKLDFGPGESVKTLVIRHDNPAKDYDPELLKLSGVITTPSEFLAKRPSECIPDQSHVTFSKKNLSITLVVNEKSKFMSVISGKLTPFPFLNGLKINMDSAYTIEELANTIKFQRMHFANKMDHKNLLFKMQNFTAKVETIRKEVNDREKGDKGKAIEEKITNLGEEMKFDFVLKVPIFEGGLKVEVPIRVEMEPRKGDVVLFLLYDEYDEVKEQAVEDVFREEMEKFAAFPIIEKD